VKLLGDLEVMLVLENVETATNVLKDTEHGLRRLLYKMRKGDCCQRAARMMTWINIIGIPISCWQENTFRRIATMHETILAFHNCRTEGHQNVTYGKVQIDMSNKGLIKEDLIVRVNGKDHIVNVVEEIRDITVVGLW
ncbi:hypothetical protein Tco_0635605, partial [Tanacetum coccineum]